MRWFLCDRLTKLDLPKSILLSLSIALESFLLEFNKVYRSMLTNSVDLKMKVGLEHTRFVRPTDTSVPSSAYSTIVC